MKRILVTGGAGFIGSNLVARLSELHPDATIDIVDDFRSGSFKNLPQFKGDFFTFDVSQTEWLANIPTDYDAIFHLASITDTMVTDQKEMVRDNVEGFRHVLSVAKHSKASVVYASSAATYGTGCEGQVSEEDVLRPANVYAFSKCMLENLAVKHHQETGLKVVGVRYFNVYGPNEAHKGKVASMIYQLAQQMKAGKNPRLFKSGEQKRDFVFVSDVVEGTLKALSSSKGIAVYNLGSGIPRSFNDIVENLNKILEIKLEPEYFDNPFDFYQNHTEANVELAKKDLGYVPRFSLEEGMLEYNKSKSLV